MSDVQSGSVWIMVFTALLSAVVSGAVTQVVIMIWQKCREDYKRRYELFETILGARFDYDSEVMVHALNRIDVVWHAYNDVRVSLKAVVEATDKPEDGSNSRQDAFLKLMESMASHLSMKEIKWDDVKRCYCPSNYLERNDSSRGSRRKQRK